jgi:antitoxin YefM
MLYFIRHAKLVQVNGQLMQGIAMEIVTFSEARNKLKAILNRVADDADYTIITRRDADDAVVMSLEYFNSLLETVHLLKSPANAAHLERSIAQYKQGQVVQNELIEPGASDE